MKKKIYILDIILIIVLVTVDQILKYLAVIKLKDKQAYSIIDGVLEFNYLENKGAAFGMLQNQKVFFIFVAVIFLCVIVFVLIKAPADRKFNRLHILLIMIGAGAVGNLIDRVRLNYVVDFIYFKLINFPIFNFADICVTVATFVLVIMILFVYQDNDFNFLSIKPKKFREIK